MASRSILTSPVISSMHSAQRQAARSSPAAIGRRSPPFKRTSKTPPGRSRSAEAGETVEADFPETRMRSSTACARVQKHLHAGRPSLSGSATKGYFRTKAGMGHSGARDRTGSSGILRRPMPFSSRNFGSFCTAMSAKRSCWWLHFSHSKVAMFVATSSGGMFTFSNNCTPFWTSAKLMLLQVVTSTAPSTGNVCDSDKRMSPVPGGESTTRTSSAPHSTPASS
mmetsp:Transcript_76104/g.219830  ORF Transcript_76104/g.219830 Transcript_76104/m.219830 type:complete len:224 (+) Transcript_76104:260-931(+)